MNILNEVDKPGSDVEEYINNLDHILTQHLEMIKNLKNKVTTFRGHLNTEAVLSK
jgi:kinesin family protein 2/24